MKVYEESLKEEVIEGSVEDCSEMPNVGLKDYISYINKFEGEGEEVVSNKVIGCNSQLYINFIIFLTMCHMLLLRLHQMLLW